MTTFDQSPLPERQSAYHAYGAVKKYSKFSCLGILLGIAVLFGSFFFLSKVHTPYDMVYVPGQNAGNGLDGSGSIWVRVDEYVPVTIQTGNSIEMGKRYFSKRFVRIYDTATRQVVKETITHDSFEVAAPLDRIFNDGESVWIVNGYDKNYPQSLQVFDGKTMDPTMNLESFSKKFPELQSGIAEIAYYEDPLHLDLLTKDGQKLSYYFDVDRLFENLSDYKTFLKAGASEYSSYLMLEGKNSSDLRKKLYSITQQSSSPWFQNYPALANSLNDLEHLKNTFDVSEVTSLLSGKIFLEGEIVYQNRAPALGGSTTSHELLIAHKSEVGDNADYLLTYIVNDQEQWTVSKSQVPILAQLNPLVNPDPFLALADTPLVQKDGEVLVVTLERIGILGLDVATGKQLWFFDPKEENFR